jgi:hypothetical protein
MIWTMPLGHPKHSDKREPGFNFSPSKRFPQKKEIARASGKT